MRLVVDEDHGSVRELFRAGLIEGLVPENDTGADMENIAEAYFSDDGQSALWVADYENAIIGMVGVDDEAHRDLVQVEFGLVSHAEFVESVCRSRASERDHGRDPGVHKYTGLPGAAPRGI